jgi:Ca-activated chloride channel family protein
VATDPATAASLGWPEAAPAPGAIASTLVTGAGEGPRGIGLADPRSSVSALLGVTALATAPLGVPLPDVPGSGTSDPAVQGALFALFNAVTLEAADQPQLLAAAVDRPVRALLVDEAAVARANAGDRAEPLAAVYPAGAATLIEVTATVVDRGDDPALVEAADALARFAASEAGRAVAVERGYRGPDGTLPGPVAAALAAAGGGSGIAGQDDPVAAPSAELLATMTFGWNGATNPGRYILVVDVSGSMAEEVPGTGRTKLEFAQAAAVEAVRQAPRSGEIGLWEFSTAVEGDTDHRELVPNGPIDDVLDTRTRREALVAAVEGLVAREDTGLYDTALAAFRRAQEQYQEGEPNLVVLVTDGRNEDTTGGIDRDTLLRTLTEEQDPARPVGITTIAYGADADVESLALISEATGGLAYVSPNPAQIGQILVAAFSGGRAGLLPGDATAPAVPGD